jgi:hypothetical protein
MPRVKRKARTNTATRDEQMLSAHLCIVRNALVERDPTPEERRKLFELAVSARGFDQVRQWLNDAQADFDRWAARKKGQRRRDKFEVIDEVLINEAMNLSRANPALTRHAAIVKAVELFYPADRTNGPMLGASKNAAIKRLMGKSKERWSQPWLPAVGSRNRSRRYRLKAVLDSRISIQPK